MMNEIPHGEMVRVRKAIRILDRKNFKPLSANLNKILCKPLHLKTTIFPPAPFPENTNKSLRRSQSTFGAVRMINQKNNNSSLSPSRIQESKPENKSKEETETRNPMISPGVDKKKSFNEMKSLLSPALRNNPIPKLVKPDLDKLNLENNQTISEQNQSFFSQGSFNNNIKNMLKMSSTTNANNLKQKGKGTFFFPEEKDSLVENKEKSRTLVKNLSGEFKIKHKRFTIKRPSSFIAKTNPRVKSQQSLQDVDSENEKNQSFKPFSTARESFDRGFDNKKKQVSDGIAQNLKKLKSMPLISTKRLPALKSHTLIDKSDRNSRNVSLSVDANISLGKNKGEKNNNSSFLTQENPISKQKNCLFRRKVFDLGETKVLSSRFDFEDKYLAIACEDSIIRVFNTQENNKIEFFLTDNNNIGIATTCVRWKPKSYQKVLLSAQATGVVSLWDVLEGEIWRSHDEDNYVYTCDFNSMGQYYATGGSDTKIRVYDLESKNPVVLLMNQEDCPGHSNRVYNVLFHPEDPNIIYSGGWDCNVFVWDLRIGESVNFISGPMICGDSMDLRDNELLTGSWRNDKQIEVWDLRTSKILADVKWVPEFPEDKSFIYSCKFSKYTKNYVVAGSTGKCELRLFDRLKNYEMIDTDKNFEFGIFSLDFLSGRDDFVCGTGEGKINSYFIRQ